MNTTPVQFQLKLSLSEQLINLLQAKADSFGVPVTQFVKHLILKEVSNENYPTYQASDWLEKQTKLALKNENKAVVVKDVDAFFKSL